MLKYRTCTSPLRTKAIIRPLGPSWVMKKNRMTTCTIDFTILPRVSRVSSSFFNRPELTTGMILEVTIWISSKINNASYPGFPMKSKFRCIPRLEAMPRSIPMTTDPYRAKDKAEVKLSFTILVSGSLIIASNNFKLANLLHKNARTVTIENSAICPLE